MSARNAVVTGGTNGLGAAIVEALALDGWNIDVLSLDIPDVLARRANVTYHKCDVTKKHDLWVAAHKVPSNVDVLINCAGINEISWLEDLQEAEWDKVLDTNAKGIFLTTQAFLTPLAVARGTVLNIISNASHMPMTASLAYNASKGAAHIMTLQLARELTRKYGITVFGISPNKLHGTGMSRYIESRVPNVRGWTKEHADQYQKQALLAGEETDPLAIAELVRYLLSDKFYHQYLTGCVLPYGA